MKLRENNLKVTRKNTILIHAMYSDKACIFLLDRNPADGVEWSSCGSEVTRKIKQLEVKGEGICPSVP